MGLSDNRAERSGSSRKWDTAPKYRSTCHGVCVDTPSPSLDNAPHAERCQSVLVIDDEPSVRMVIAEVVREFGYEAIEAIDGPSGLAILVSGARIDLLISDVALPNGMNGRQVAEAARQVLPGLKVLFITGYAEHAALTGVQLELGMQVMVKPFTMEALGSRINAMIGDDKGSDKLSDAQFGWERKQNASNT